ncbi:MAG: NAD-dependent epimerase [Saprospiraceae bacterium]|nr:NAD-dependent epimerase [Saprospiraceae bacterium]
MKLLITGTAGFVGYHFANRMVRDGHDVVGLDSINDYYDVQLKYDRLKAAGISREKRTYNTLVESTLHPNYRFIQLQLEDAGNLERLFAREHFDAVVHLAAQAGVRYSLNNPRAYVESNILGFLNLLEACRYHPVQHLVFASSSSVYGMNTAQPFSVLHNVDHPVSLYAASKKSNELMAHTYSHLFGVPATGLRFFTVYGPWGRPDMAYFTFTQAILAGEPIKVYNYGHNARDFTYIDDIVESMARLLPIRPEPVSREEAEGNPARSTAPYRLFNIGNSSPVALSEFIRTIEEALGKKAVQELVPAQPGDVTTTFADVADLEAVTGYRPQTTLKDGIGRFVAWYLGYVG